uniref:Gfo/Idh/MocA-like oxidoreductase N-terminal domain-containing protein n=1 Tax=Chromera velia CCMP2878 TaxID=1169474 RepID=A0A0G4FHJ1_9ALVE|eukprot:Cvel_3343.t1-p1 / transcript=Cvel_3343.t1 / gene=Cvel_3343 / organism=Chromera_velia_CCMP2878 / gene_product=hypothetical protein / transcript_product=hypothetical protein / location=Cvel_scaffold133:49775-53488(+) / protein_length=592 / sequence_SO=supercontig / SO=protein_coding / is_pseudo=false
MTDVDGVWLIGCGKHAIHYGKILGHLGRSFLVIGRGENSANEFLKKFEEACPDVKSLPEVKLGGLQQFLSTKPPICGKAILCLPVENLASATYQLIRYGVKDILVEKPLGKNSSELDRLVKVCEAEDHRPRVFVAYNRRFYASVTQAKALIEKEGILSAKLDFSERTDQQALRVPYLLMGNSSHMLDVLFFLAGMPVELHPSHSHSGDLDFFPGPSVFVGHGKTDKDVSFSYHANWNSAGRWAVEVITRERKLILSPVEKLQEMPKGTFNLSEVDPGEFAGAYKRDQVFKPGLFDLTEAFLKLKEGDLPPPSLPSVEDQLELVRYYERIEGQRSDSQVWVVGCGNIGMRHLQGIAKFKGAPFTLKVVEKSDEALQKASNAFHDEAKKGSVDHILVPFTDCASLVGQQPVDANVILIATTADARFQVLKELFSAEVGDPSSFMPTRILILEKPLFQRERDYDEAPHLFSRLGLDVYVHLPHRIHPHILQFKDKLAAAAAQEPVHMRYGGFHWGLGCNGIHGLDLFLMMNGEVREVLPAKRKGACEFLGELKVTHPNGAALTLVSGWVGGEGDSLVWPGLVGLAGWVHGLCGRI